jgi:hypothetical protein
VGVPDGNAPGEKVSGRNELEAALAGSAMWKRAPPVLELLMVMVPARRWTACFTSARPRPRPNGPAVLVLKP